MKITRLTQTSYSKSNVNFKKLTTVRYAMLDNVLLESEDVIEKITKTLVKIMKNKIPQNENVRNLIGKCITDFNPDVPFQSVKFLKSYKRGRIFNIISGDEAYQLKKIWSSSKNSKEVKKSKAGEIIGKLVNGPTTFIGIKAKSEQVKDKTKYIIENLYVTA